MLLVLQTAVVAVEAVLFCMADGVLHAAQCNVTRWLRHLQPGWATLDSAQHPFEEK